MMSVAGRIDIGVIADFNARNFVAALTRACHPVEAHCKLFPFGQTVQSLHWLRSNVGSGEPQALVLWTTPELVVPSFSQAMQWQPFSLDEVLAEVDAFTDLVDRTTSSARIVVIPTWTLSALGSGLGSLDTRPGLGLVHTLMSMNLRLIERLSRNPRVIILDAQKWLTAGGRDAHSARLWYRSKTPFNGDVFTAAAADVAALVTAGRGLTKKVVIVDLDNTLWGGVVGDVGLEGIRLGGHDPAGEAFVDVQRVLKRLSRRGVLLAIASKNEETTALQTIERHPEMVLRPDDFVGWRINWKDKAENIAELMGSLNLGLDSAVFLDDSPFERERVRSVLPMVLVPDLPSEPLEIPRFISSLRCFDNPVFSDEDRLRTAMYVADRKRSASKEEAGTLADWLRSLELRVDVRDVDNVTMNRTVQLLQRTNQMNLSTRRLSRAEILEWLAGGTRRLWTFSVTDRFGDYGLCGIVSTEKDRSGTTIRDFVVSCRVLGRGVEDAMLAVAARHALSHGDTALMAGFVPSARNRPIERWLRERPSVAPDGDLFRFESSVVASIPEHVNLHFHAEEKATDLARS